jgi:5'-3' exoribonuclease 2
MMAAVFEYTERVINMVRPRKLLMIAVDGVAPRAKMNQQRSRRFRAAQEAKDKEIETEKALAEWKAAGIPVSMEAQEKKKAWDSNAITPGTPFQALLTESLRYWIAKKLNQDPGWKDLQVILSDASVPGEGEHKIMDHIRRQRSHPEHDPNTKHVIYGLDADLIMLSLATHEPHFRVLREDVFAQDQKGRACHRCGKEGHIAANCIGEPKEKSGEHDEIGQKQPEKKPFIFLDVGTLREYLEVDLNIPALGFSFDLERAIDDWVFLIFFVGNDFLPHLPSLEIREGAIDTLLKIWKSELPRMGSYLTNHGKVEMKNAQIILEGIGRQEDEIFQRRKEAEERQDANTKRRKIEDEERQRNEMAMEKFNHGQQEYVETRIPLPGRTMNGEVKTESVDPLEARKANLSAAEKLRAELMGGMTTTTVNPVKKEIKEEAEDKANGVKDVAMPDPIKTEGVEKEEETDGVLSHLLPNDDDDARTASSSQRGTKRAISDVDDEMASSHSKSAKTVKTEEADEDIGNESVDPVVTTNKQRKLNADGTVDVEDTVKLWEPGYRERYYQQKFGVGLEDVEYRRQVVKSYMEGLSWVLAYYYQGCPSWTWYYPYHFSPFAADFTDLDTLDIQFDQGKPFRPYDQLMGVLPAASRASIPPAFHSLMTEETSEIIDFYPEEFSIDMNGKKMAWQGVALLPFIDERRLLEAIDKKYKDLTEDEVKRNGVGDHILVVAEEHDLYDDLCALYAKRNNAQLRLPLNPQKSRGITGFVKPDPDCIPNSTYNSPLTSIGLNDIINDRSITVFYEFPEQRKPHRSILLNGAKAAKKRLTEEDREVTRQGGPRGRGRGRGRGGRGGYNHHSHNDQYQSAANGHGAPAGRQPYGGKHGYSNGYDNQRGGYESGRGGFAGGNYPYNAPPPPQYQQPQQNYYGGSVYDPYGQQPSAHYQQPSHQYQPQQPSRDPYGSSGYGGGAYGSSGGYGGYGGYSNGAGAAYPPPAAQYGGHGQQYQSPYGQGYPPPQHQYQPRPSGPPQPLMRGGANGQAAPRRW